MSPLESRQERVALYRRRAEEMDQLSFKAVTLETHRAYKILAREWRKMAAELELTQSRDKDVQLRQTIQTVD